MGSLKVLCLRVVAHLRVLHGAHCCSSRPCTRDEVSRCTRCDITGTSAYLLASHLGVIVEGGKRTPAPSLSDRRRPQQPGYMTLLLSYLAS
jgi:hypothetical protein